MEHSSASPGQLQDIAIRNARARRLQGRLAIPTILIPLLGVAAAAAQVFMGRVGAMEVGLLVSMYSLIMTGMIVGFHRCFSHRAFQARQPVRVLLAILGSMAGQGPVINWVSTHRRHHAHSDGVGDPHSPHVRDDGQRMGLLRGFWHAQVGWMLEGDVTNAARFAKDFTRDPLMKKLNGLYPVWLLLGLLIPTLIGALLRGSAAGALQGFIWGGLVPIAAAQHVTWGASIAHLVGTRPFDTGKDDQSRNNPLLAIPLLGDGWHNNHHAFPGVAICGFEWWQIDPGGWIIRGLEKLGLVYDVKGVPERSSRLARQRLSAGPQAGPGPQGAAD